LYIGTLHTDLPTIEYLGIEIRKGSGENDGTHENTKYFSCPLRKGLFIQRKQVRKVLSTMGKQELANRSRTSTRDISIKETPGGPSRPPRITRGAINLSKSSSKLHKYPVGTQVLFSFVQDWFPATVEQHVGKELVLLKVASTEKTKQIRLENQVYKVHVNRLRNKGETLPPISRSLNAKKRRSKISQPVPKRKPKTEYHHQIKPVKKRLPEKSLKLSRSNTWHSNNVGRRKKQIDASKKNSNRRASRNRDRAEDKEEDKDEINTVDHPFGDHPAMESLELAKAYIKEGEPDEAIPIFKDVIEQFKNACFDVNVNMNQKNKRRTYLGKLRRYVEDLITNGSSKVVLEEPRIEAHRKRKKMAEEITHGPRREKVHPRNAKVSAPSGRNKKEHQFQDQDAAFRARLRDDVVDSSPGVRFSQVLGLSMCKLALYESVILPAANPQLFTGLRKPPKGILLFGPPGNGKTMIAKAVATECKATFFGVSASTITSKYVGDQERIMRCLFQMAREEGPSIIFMDEVDSLLTSRGGTKEHESSRRVKTEFLVSMDGIHVFDDDHNSRVLVIAATNLPQQIDDAVLRRFGKRIPVPMPDATTRKHVILKLVEDSPTEMSQDELNAIVYYTDGYSCSDLSQLVGEAAMGPIRDVGIMAKTITASSLGSIKYKHFEKALETIRPSVPKSTIKICDDWAEHYGSKIALKLKELPVDMIATVESMEKGI